MGIGETVMIYAIAILFVAPHLGMVLVVIWTILSPPLAKSKKTAHTTTGQKKSCSSADIAHNHRRLLQSNQHIHNAHEQSHRMSQDAHDAAARDAWVMHDNAAARDAWVMHDNADHIAQSAHDTAVNDHNFAVDLHDHVANDPGFGCGPFF